MTKNKNSQLVYSTNPDISLNNTHDEPHKSNESKTAYIERDRKGRKGKVVTVVSRLGGDLRELQKELQKYCGAGGSVKNNNIEIQGDHRDKISNLLQSKGYKTKFVGG